MNLVCESIGNILVASTDLLDSDVFDQTAQANSA